MARKGSLIGSMKAAVDVVEAEASRSAAAPRHANPRRRDDNHGRPPSQGDAIPAAAGGSGEGRQSGGSPICLCGIGRAR